MNSGVSRQNCTVFSKEIIEFQQSKIILFFIHHFIRSPKMQRFSMPAAELFHALLTLLIGTIAILVSIFSPVKNHSLKQERWPITILMVKTQKLSIHALADQQPKSSNNHSNNPISCLSLFAHVKESTGTKFLFSSRI